jgi:single-strand DNA-binding protein
MESYSMNRVILIGRLGRDPEVRYTNSGDAVANLSLATSETWKDKNGERQERTEWHRIVVFRNRAEFAKEYLSKGRMLAIEGKLRTRDWEDKNGNKRYTTEILANTLTILDGRKDRAGKMEEEPPAALQSDQEEEEEEIPF